MVRIVVMFVLLLPVAVNAQVLGSCGTTDADKPAAETYAPGEAPVFQMPLPGDQAPNFELPAVVQDEIKMIKLSDYDGKWRVVCFYPADFTFV